jgi:YfiH family protein
VLLRSVALGDGSVVHAAFTQRGDGDFADGAAPIGIGPAVAHTWLRQQHGSAVVVVGAPGDRSGAAADAAVSEACDTPLTIRTADCAPVALYSSNGMIGAVHAGWHGLVAGVVPACIAAMRERGGRDLHAIVGPCIHPECYEFGRDDLARVVATVGDAATGVTASGAPAMDLAAAVGSALRAGDVIVDEIVDQCTACRPGDYFSHRARRERARHVMVVWRTPAAGPERPPVEREAGPERPSSERGPRP